MKKSLDELFNDIKTASDKVATTTNNLLAERNNGELNDYLYKAAVDAQNEWRRAVDMYNAAKKRLKEQSDSR